MISADEACNLAASVLRMRADEKLEETGTLIEQAASNGYFSLSLREELSPIIVDLLKEEGYVVKIDYASGESLISWH